MKKTQKPSSRAEKNLKFFQRLPKVEIEPDFHSQHDEPGFEFEEITTSHRVVTKRHECTEKNTRKPKYIIRVYKGNGETSGISSLNRIFAYEKVHSFREAIRTHYALIEFFKDRGQ